MAEIPSGSFWMGCNDVDIANPAFDSSCALDERPLHLVETDPYLVDVYEATAQSFVPFLNATGKLSENPDCVGDGHAMACFVVVPEDLFSFVDGSWLLVPGSESMPVYGVSFAAAAEYCGYLGKRLCTESEWEKAARGGCETYAGDCKADSRIYPWGNQAPDCTLAQTKACAPLGYSPVGHHEAGASPYWIEDMAGNVDEWVADCYHPGYTGAPASGAVWPCDDVDAKGLTRGGGLTSIPIMDMRASARTSMPYAGELYPGIRCCRSAD